MSLTEEKRSVYQNIIYLNSPWIKSGERPMPPKEFKRECFFEVRKEINATHNMAILIKGPRRVGKTEIQKQLIYELIVEKKLNPKAVLYLTLDDLQIQSENTDQQARMVQNILNEWAQLMDYDDYDSIKSESYCFLDEVQAVRDWDLLVKNRVERNPNVKIVLSGSAAHTIFQKSLKTLMGRVIPVEITTFSFREFLSFKRVISEEHFSALKNIQLEFSSSLSANNVYKKTKDIVLEYDHKQLRSYITSFLIEGGFPQLWQISSGFLEKAHFIDENYVKKVTLEDLMLLQQIKKPEIYERLLRHLFANPAQEYNQSSVANKLGVTEITLAEAIKLLQQTDLLIFVEKFSNKAEPLKRQNLKIYPIDYALTLAMTKQEPDIFDDSQKGTIAETLTAQTIKRFKGLSRIAFLQNEKNGQRKEIDFYLRSDFNDCPIEVKYRNQILERDLAFLKFIIKEKQLESGIVISIDEWKQSENLNYIPLWAFMLLG